MRVMIIEDELASREILKALLDEFFQDIQIVATAGTVAEAVPKIRQHHPDLVFLDIELPMENGFSLMNHFDPIPFKVIFTTAYEEYAIRAFRISAIDYLLKPIDLEELQQAVEKAKGSSTSQPGKNLQHLRDNYFGKDPKLSLATNEGYLFIKIEDIIRCEADGRYTRFYLQNGTKHLTAKNIGEFESILYEFSFLRVHRSQIINLNKIKRYIKGRPPEVVMEDDTHVVVSNAQREPLLTHLGLM
ncbi:MAG: LytTR family DNA-binding domain-containing protein [Bacteroidota bacterium]